MAETLEEFVERLKGLKFHTDGFAVRDDTGELRTLTSEEKKSLGVFPKERGNLPEGYHFSLDNPRFVISASPLFPDTTP